jgi:phosphoribosyl-ATP pyrophosphohydrolase/phosphoribosyl-AMP cyclohydrolase
MENILKNLKFDSHGLIPAVVQNEKTKEVLMVAYMNEEAVRQTIETKRATFWSRSRKAMWVKGETSGNYMYVKELRIDCDGDCLLVLADPAGPACHTGNRTCFYRKAENGGIAEVSEKASSADILERLIAVTQDRKLHPKDGSYTNYLFDKGDDKILKKVGEEAAEVVIAGKNSSFEEISYEVADLMYHLTVMLVSKDMTWNDIYEELEKRR